MMLNQLYFLRAQELPYTFHRNFYLGFQLKSVKLDTVIQN